MIVWRRLSRVQLDALRGDMRVSACWRAIRCGVLHGLTVVPSCNAFLLEACMSACKAWLPSFLAWGLWADQPARRVSNRSV